MLPDVWQAQPAKLTVPGTQTTATIQNLNPASSYHLRIMAENRLGLSDPSEVIQVTTQEEGEGKHFFLVPLDKNWCISLK